jgi:hypothetical protein
MYECSYCGLSLTRWGNYLEHVGAVHEGGKGMTKFKWLGEMFKGDSADMCTRKFLKCPWGDELTLSSVRRRGVRTPIGEFFIWPWIKKGETRVC